jgi:tRNA(Arg) A34 adenosine deaminase TadA
MTDRGAELMGEALVEARKSLDLDEFPIGAELVALLEARGGKVSRGKERQDATLYTTLEPCALCMAAAMSFLLGRIVFALEAPVDGGTNLPVLWQPPNGHPPDGMPYTIPELIGGVGREASAALVAEWARRDPERTWAVPAPYIPKIPLLPSPTPS